MTQISTLASALLLAALTVASANGQGGKSFKVRLAPMPLDLAMAANMTGVGALTAVLAGTTLTLTGSFEGLSSPATVARLHKSPKPGMRGEPVLDLQVPKATSGSLNATLTLTPQQVQDLQNGRLYVQIHSEKAPDGNLWGWLFPQETKR
jgi:hypothetical protein